MFKKNAINIYLFTFNIKIRKKCQFFKYSPKINTARHLMDWYINKIKPNHFTSIA